MVITVDVDALALAVKKQMLPSPSWRKWAVKEGAARKPSSPAPLRSPPPPAPAPYESFSQLPDT